MGVLVAHACCGPVGDPCTTSSAAGEWAAAAANTRSAKLCRLCTPPSSPHRHCMRCRPTGDGAGLLAAMPDTFFAHALEEEQGLRLPQQGDYAGEHSLLGCTRLTCAVLLTGHDSGTGAAHPPAHPCPACCVQWACCSCRATRPSVPPRAPPSRRLPARWALRAWRGARCGSAAGERCCRSAAHVGSPHMPPGWASCCMPQLQTSHPSSGVGAPALDL